MVMVHHACSECVCDVRWCVSRRSGDGQVSGNRDSPHFRQYGFPAINRSHTVHVVSTSSTYYLRVVARWAGQRCDDHDHGRSVTVIFVVGIVSAIGMHAIDAVAIIY